MSDKVNFNLEIDVEKFSELVPLETSILDYGCGYGRNCNLLQSHGFTNIIGCDSYQGMVNRGVQEFPSLSLFQNKDIYLEYPDNSFGAIVLCAVLTCVIENNEQLKLLGEVSRLLKPEGVLHVVEFCNPVEKLFESGVGVMMHYQTPDDLRQMLNDHSSELSSEVGKVETMSGKSVEAVSYFGSKCSD